MFHLYQWWMLAVSRWNRIIAVRSGAFNFNVFLPLISKFMTKLEMNPNGMKLSSSARWYQFSAGLDVTTPATRLYITPFITSSGPCCRTSSCHLISILWCYFPASIWHTRTHTSHIGLLSIILMGRVGQKTIIHWVFGRWIRHGSLILFQTELFASFLKRFFSSSEVVESHDSSRVRALRTT